MNRALWIAQGWLAIIFLAAGAIKLARSKTELARLEGMAYVTERSAAKMKAIGLAEVLGALGLVLPWMLGVLPLLTPVAAAGLAAMMVGAVATHVRRNEGFLLPAVLLALSLFVTAGRLGVLG